MLYIEFFENSLPTDKKIKEILKYISSIVKLTSKPTIETSDNNSFYVDVNDTQFNDIMTFSQNSPPLKFSISNSNLRSWISLDKRKSIEYSMDNPESIDTIEDIVETEESENKEIDNSEESEESDEHSESDHDKVEMLETTNPQELEHLDVVDFHSMKNIVEKKNTLVCKDECYRRICTKKKKTHPFMTKYEKTRLLCIRAQQIVNGAQILVDIPIEKQNDIHYIVSKELEEKKLPLIIRRYLPNGDHEDWKANELSFIS